MQRWLEVHLVAIAKGPVVSRAMCTVSGTHDVGVVATQLETTSSIEHVLVQADCQASEGYARAMSTTAVDSPCYNRLSRSGIDQMTISTTNSLATTYVRDDPVEMSRLRTSCSHDREHLAANIVERVSGRPCMPRYPARVLKPRTLG